jgi:phosphoserine phosphatase RsbU/P
VTRRQELAAGSLVFAFFLVHVGLETGRTWTSLERIGLPGWVPAQEGNRVLVDRLDDPAAVVPLAVGDEVLAVDGRGLTNARDVYTNYYTSGPGGTTRLLARHDGRLVEARLARAPASFGWFALLTLGFRAVCLLFLFAGGAMFLFARRDSSQALLLAAVFVLFPAIEGSGHMGLLSLSAYVVAVAAQCIALAVFWAAFLHFFLVFPKRSPVLDRFPALLRWLYILSALFTAPVFLLVSVLMRTDTGTALELARAGGPLLVAFRVLTIAYPALGLLSLAYSYLRASTATRRRLRVVVAGSFAALLPVIALAVLGSFVRLARLDAWVLWSIGAVVILALPILPLAFAYAIVRHQVLPVEMIVRRGVRYLLVSKGFVLVELFVVVVLVAFLLTGARAAWIDQWGARADIVTTLVASSAAWFGLRALNARVRTAIDRRFFRESYDAQEILRELGQAVREEPTIDALLPLVLGQIQDALHNASAIVFLREEATGVFRAALGWGHEAAPDSRPPVGLELPRDHTLLSRLEGELHPVLLDPDVPDALLGRIALLLPVATKRERLGFIALGPRLGDLPYSRDDRELLMAVAGQMGFAIENARLVRKLAQQERLRHELAIAAEVQRRLFPARPPRSERLDLAAVCLPAGGVGGDYYDFLELGAGRVGLAVADVAGKGFPAALLMSIVQASLRSQAGSGEVALAAIAASMNRLLHRSTARNSFASFFYAVFDEAAATLRYVNAGHNPPFLFRASATSNGGASVGVLSAARGGASVAIEAPASAGARERLLGSGLVLGAVAETSYEERAVRVGPGDVLVAYTDGVTETFSPEGEEFGEERLRTTVERAFHLDAAAIRDRIVAAARDWRRTAPQHDDLTLVVAKVRASL